MYKHVFSPLKIRNVEIPNRLAVTAMVTDYCNPDGTCTERFIKYHEEKAKGGWGLIFTEDFQISPKYKGYPCIAGLYRDDQIEGFQKLTERIHKYPTKIFAQLYHPGRQSMSEVQGYQPVAPSAIPCPLLKEIPREITVEEIHETVEQFGDSALRAKKAGFDGVEIHLAHGYLLFEFLSPYANKRVDEYGGCFDNRLRIVKEVYRNVRSKVGDDFAVTCRISSRDGFFGGREIADSMELAMELEAMGFDAINVSSGMYGNHVNLDIDAEAHSFNVPNAEKIKKVVDIPVFAAYRINTIGQAEVAIKTGQVDAIGMGRTTLADPHFPNKAKEGRFQDIRHCINCNLGCYGGLFSPELNYEVTCLVNPMVGREYEFDYSKVENPKKVLIAGGGPGGMEAAIIAKRKGHNVTLYEATDKLGGQFLSAAFPPGKGELTYFTSWQIHMIKKLGIEVKFNTPLTKEIVENEKPDSVIVATGAKPLVPPIKGFDSNNVVTAEDALLGKVFTGDNVVVCGGGEVGSETAAHIAMRDNGKVTIVEMLPNIFAGLRLQGLMDQYKVQVNVNTKVLEITNDSVIVEKNGETVIIPAETVILAFGYKPNNSLAAELKDICDVKVIGGSVKTSNALNATRDALEAVMSL